MQKHDENRAFPRLRESRLKITRKKALQPRYQDYRLDKTGLH
jgi:hypothetical protein